MFKPNKYQEEIYLFIKEQVELMKNGGQPKNMVNVAGAGCGKSATIVKGLEYIPSGLNVKMCAFNKDIVTSLSGKVPSNVKVQTFHSIGFGTLRYVFKNVKVDDKKMENIFQELVNGKYRDLEEWEFSEMRSPFLKIIGLLKNTFSSSTSENILSLVDKHNIDLGDVNEGILFDIIHDGLEMSNANPMIVDFDDMIYIPVRLKLNIYKNDVVFVDETQDLNTVQLIMLQRMVKDNGFVVCVGDPNQSIYGFRGADPDAMNRIITDLKAEVLPLQMTYRCGKNIVLLANKIVPELEAFEGNPDGEVIQDVNIDVFYDMIGSGDMILCRNTAPLIKPAFHMLAIGKKVIIKGRDIGEGLVKLVKKLHGNSLEEFFMSLDKWRDGEVAKATRKKSNSMLQSIEDKYMCIEAIADGCSSRNEIISKIGSIFSDGSAEIVFSTVHRAKGLEADRVFILAPELMPSKWAVKDWEIVQERNIMYVAITRAKFGLYIVEGRLRI